MVDAGGQWQDHEEFLGEEGVAAQIDPILAIGSSLWLFEDGERVAPIPLSLWLAGAGERPGFEWVSKSTSVQCGNDVRTGGAE